MSFGHVMNVLLFVFAWILVLFIAAGAALVCIGMAITGHDEAGWWFLLSITALLADIPLSFIWRRYLEPTLDAERR
jgi:hypothetical protein